MGQHSSESCGYFEDFLIRRVRVLDLILQHVSVTAARREQMQDKTGITGTDTYHLGHDRNRDKPGSIALS